MSRNQNLASIGTSTQIVDREFVIICDDFLNHRDGYRVLFYRSGDIAHGFLRAADGTFTRFDPSGSTYTYVAGINDNGDTTGYYYGSDGVAHGFVRSSDGSISTIDAEGATGTFANAINGKGEVVGFYTDSAENYHGFLRTP